jgi:hypothetical protein
MFGTVEHIFSIYYTYSVHNGVGPCRLGGKIQLNPRENVHSLKGKSLVLSVIFSSKTGLGQQEKKTNS